MKLTLLLLGTVFAGFCGKSANVSVGNITANTTWVNTNIYYLDSATYILNNATLTIQEGTTIMGRFGTLRPCLVVTRGAKLIAIGTPSLPITFTSSRPPGSRNPGDWGGLVICGKAKVNQAPGWANIEGFPTSASVTPSEISYGGTDDADNSGTLKYVRVEFAGIAFAPNQEINGITFGGVGNGTTVDYVQVSYCGDDSYEFFGGSVNCKHLIAYHGWDDDFDTDNGFSGKIQYGLSARHPNLADISGSNGFESDNDATGTLNNPRTSCVFSNMTLIGPLRTTTTPINSLFRRGNHIRRSSKLSLFNSLVMGWPGGLFIDGTNTKNEANLDSLGWKNNIISGCPIPLLTQSGGAIDSLNPITGIYPWFASKSTGSSILSINDSVMLTSPFDTAGVISAIPMAGSPALTGSSFTSSRLAGFDSVAYRGAFGSVDWTAAWSSFTPKTNVYEEKIAFIPEFSFSIASDSLLENGGTYTVRVKVKNASLYYPTSVTIAPSGTATSGADYSLSATTVTFAPGDSVDKNIVITLVDDNFLEPLESVILSFTGNNNNSIIGTPGTFTLFIKDNDITVKPTPTVYFATATGNVWENGGTYTVNVKIASVSPAFATTVNVAFTGTATNTDYTAGATTVTFPAGDSADKNIVITILNDAIVEADETVILTITSSVTDYVVGAQSTHTLRILNEDSTAPSSILSVNNVTKVYPNPATNFITIESSDLTQKGSIVEIINISGQIILTETITKSNNTLNISQLNNGLYFAKVYNEGNTLTTRFTIFK